MTYLHTIRRTIMADNQKISKKTAYCRKKTTEFDSLICRKKTTEFDSLIAIKLSQRIIRQQKQKIADSLMF